MIILDNNTLEIPDMYRKKVATKMNDKSWFARRLFHLSFSVIIKMTDQIDRVETNR